MLSADSLEFVPGRWEHSGTAAFAKFGASFSAKQSKRSTVSAVALRVIDLLAVGTANVSTLHPRELRKSSTKHGISMTARA